MKKSYHTTRLLLNEMSTADNGFILELVNTEAWIRFIGDRHIHTKEQATTYIQNLLNNPAINYRVARLNESMTPIGVITFMKRDYLEHYDIGFAFLPEHTKKGYASEALAVVLKDILDDPEHPVVLATTLTDNVNSIRLLERSGFIFEKEIFNKDLLLLVFFITKEIFLQATGSLSNQ